MDAQQTDQVSAAPVERLAACLDIAAGGTLPQLWHWLFFLDAAPSRALGRDGHRAHGGPVTHDPDLPRRMWAGGRLAFFHEIAIGATLQRQSRIAQTTEREGRSGRLRFVTLRHMIFVDAKLAIEEEQDLVFRAPVGLRQDVTPAAYAPPWASIRTVVPDEILLFRFSALTFNAHRVHYDLAYARDVEHYPGLLVHGPLQAILLAGHLREAAPTAAIRQFDYRNLAPAFVNQTLQLEAWPDAESQTVWQLQTRNPNGAICMRAKARIEHNPVPRNGLT